MNEQPIPIFGSTVDVTRTGCQKNGRDQNEGAMGTGASRLEHARGFHGESPVVRNSGPDARSRSKDPRVARIGCLFLGVLSV